MEKIRAIIIIFIGITVLAVVGFVFQDFLEKSEPTHGSASDNVSGWGWSDTIGWISFNCTDFGCGSSDYGVNVDFGTGDFSGYAWSDNIGWITFNPAGPYPAAPQNPAHLESDYKVTGWARAILCEIAGNCNGWDGWIKLGDSTGIWSGGGVQNQVSINVDTNEFEGWAWGSDIIGWISFNCKGPDMCGD